MFNDRFVRVWLLFLVFTTPLFAEAESKVTIIDYYGREVRISTPLGGIVSLAPNITETVFALGHGKRLLGRTTWCDYPPGVAAVPTVGDLLNPDVERIVDLKADIVIASSHFDRQSLERLEEVDQKVVILQGPESFKGAVDGVIRPLSRLLGDEASGERLVADMEETMRRAEARAAGHEGKPTVYYVVGFGEGGDWTAGSDTFISELISRAGGINIASDIKGWAFSLEALVDADPDVIILPEWAMEDFRTAPVYGELRASREGRLYSVDESILVRQGPRLAEGFALLVSIISSSAGAVF